MSLVLLLSFVRQQQIFYHYSEIFVYFVFKKMAENSKSMFDKMVKNLETQVVAFVDDDPTDAIEASFSTFEKKHTYIYITTKFLIYNTKLEDTFKHYFCFVSFSGIKSQVQNIIQITVTPQFTSYKSSHSQENISLFGAVYKCHEEKKNYV